MTRICQSLHWTQSSGAPKGSDPMLLSLTPTPTTPVWILQPDSAGRTSSTLDWWVTLRSAESPWVNKQGREINEQELLASQVYYYIWLASPTTCPHPHTGVKFHRSCINTSARLTRSATDIQSDAFDLHGKPRLNEAEGKEEVDSSSMYTEENICGSWPNGLVSIYYTIVVKG